jgi:hypothetical protein
VDTFERLRKRNQDHEKQLKEQRRDEIRYMPYAFLGFMVYCIGFYLFNYYTGSAFGPEIPKITKRIYLLSVVSVGGVGALFFSASLSVIISSHLANNEGTVKLRTFGVSIVSISLLTFSFSFLGLARYLSNLIFDNAFVIYRVLHFRDGFIDGFLEYFFGVLIILIALIVLKLFIFVFSLPFYAREAAKKYAAK